MGNTIFNFDPTISDFNPFSPIAFSDSGTGTNNNFLVNPSDTLTNQIISILQQFTATETFLDILRQYIGTDTFLDDFRQLVDNLITDDREFILFDNSLVQQCNSNPGDITSIFNASQIQIIAKQAFDIGSIDTITYNNIVNDPTNIYKYCSTDIILGVMQKQLNYVTRVPRLTDLENIGLDDLIKNIILANPNELINTDIIHQSTDTYLTQVFSTIVFTPYAQAQAILANPQNILSILTTASMTRLMNLVMPYLDFILPSTITSVQAMTDPTQISSVLSNTEIVLMIDQEINIKKGVLSSLSPGELQSTFNTLTSQYTASLDALITSSVATSVAAAVNTAVNTAVQNLDIQITQLTSDEVQTWINAVN